MADEPRRSTRMNKGLSRSDREASRATSQASSGPPMPPASVVLLSPPPAKKAHAPVHMEEQVPPPSEQVLKDVPATPPPTALDSGQSSAPPTAAVVGIMPQASFTTQAEATDSPRRLRMPPPPVPSTLGLRTSLRNEPPILRPDFFTEDDDEDDIELATIDFQRRILSGGTDAPMYSYDPQFKAHGLQRGAWSHIPPEQPALQMLTDRGLAVMERSHVRATAERKAADDT